MTETDKLELAHEAEQLTSVLHSMKQEFVGKDEIIDLLGISLVARENLFLLGPPGTAKSALIGSLARRMGGKSFDYLLTRFTEPNELFGPFDIRRLREGDLVTNTEGMLPEATLVFLDELLNANSAILNSLLMVLNERVFRRGRETTALPTLMVIGASNLLPEDTALAALFDRFLLRVQCDNVAEESLGDVLKAGWQLESTKGKLAAEQTVISVEDVMTLQGQLPAVSLDDVRPAYLDLIYRLRQAGIEISDRRAVKLQRVIASSAILCGRSTARVSDLWVLRYVWDRQEQQEVLASIVDAAIHRGAAAAGDHPRSSGADRPDAEALARNFDAIESQLVGELSAADRSFLTDRTSILSGRLEWVENEIQRSALSDQVERIWAKLGARPE